MLYYLSQITLAARAYNKAVIDGPYYNVSDEFSYLCNAQTHLLKTEYVQLKRIFSPFTHKMNFIFRHDLATARIVFH